MLTCDQNTVNLQHRPSEENGMVTSSTQFQSRGLARYCDMSTVKTYRKGIVSKGELVFDQNLNPLQNKKTSKSISLQSWIANTLPKTLERANAQANQTLIDNASNQSTRFSNLGTSQFPTQPYAPSQHIYGYQVLKAAGNEGMCDPSIPTANRLS